MPVARGAKTPQRRRVGEVEILQRLDLRKMGRADPHHGVSNSRSATCCCSRAAKYSSWDQFSSRACSAGSSQNTPIVGVFRTPGEVGEHGRQAFLRCRTGAGLRLGGGGHSLLALCSQGRRRRRNRASSSDRARRATTWEWPRASRTSCSAPRTLPWDHAPGALLLAEAGGIVQRLDGSVYQLADDRCGLLVAVDAVLSA